ncbi:hypothetical protein RRG08_041535 [Elysia crispata]|uniref:Uncharacterized protein n=1 Tax=Elysia crispata TaxID=231223 RepID=A0AAE0ZUV5_9GAST|nr:hypothetical protein RRG08_041535 [Elysia crispata]
MSIGPQTRYKLFQGAVCADLRPSARATTLTNPSRNLGAPPRLLPGKRLYPVSGKLEAFPVTRPDNTTIPEDWSRFYDPDLADYSLVLWWRQRKPF